MASPNTGTIPPGNACCIDVSGASALLQRASALIAGNRAQHGANERQETVKGRAGDLDLGGQAARQRMAQAFQAAASRRVAEQQRQADSWADRKPIGRRHGGYPVAVGWISYWYQLQNRGPYLAQPAPGQPVGGHQSNPAGTGS